MQSLIPPHSLLFKNFQNLQEKRQNGNIATLTVPKELQNHGFWVKTTFCEVWYILKHFVTIHCIIQMVPTLQTANIFMLAGLSVHFCYKKLGGLLQIISKE